MSALISDMVEKTDTAEVVAAATVLVERHDRKKWKKLQDHGTRLAIQYKNDPIQLLELFGYALDYTKHRELSDIMGYMSFTLSENLAAKFEVHTKEKESENDDTNGKE